MKEFKYVITDELGIHARPAGMLVKAAKEFADTTVTITKGSTTVKATQLMKLMSLACKKGDEITVSVEGGAEADAAAALEAFFKANL